MLIKNDKLISDNTGIYYWTYLNSFFIKNYIMIYNMPETKEE